MQAIITVSNLHCINYNESIFWYPQIHIAYTKWNTEHLKIMIHLFDLADFHTIYALNLVNLFTEQLFLFKYLEVKSTFYTHMF